MTEFNICTILKSVKLANFNLVPENKVDELKKLNLSIANRSEKSFEKEEINLLK